MKPVRNVTNRKKARAVVVEAAAAAEHSSSTLASSKHQQQQRILAEPLLTDPLPQLCGLPVGGGSARGCLPGPESGSSKQQQQADNASSRIAAPAARSTAPVVWASYRRRLN